MFIAAIGSLSQLNIKTGSVQFMKKKERKGCVLYIRSLFVSVYNVLMTHPHCKWTQNKQDCNNAVRTRKK